MRIEYLFTKSRLKRAWGSKLIAWATGKLCPDLDSCSHVAIKIDDIIIESSVSKGVSLVPYSYWIKKHEVIHAFKCRVNRKCEKVIHDSMYATYGKGYDWCGILFFAWRMLGFLIFKRPLPKINRFHNNNKFFCVEVLSAITGENYQMTSPIQLVSIWNKAKMPRIDVRQYKENNE